MSAGDVYLFHRPTSWTSFRRDPWGTTMTALIHLTTRSKWNHASLGIGPDKNGVEMMVEATSNGIAVNPISSVDEITVIEHNTPLVESDGWTCRSGSQFDNCYGGNDLEEVLAWSTGRVGWRYGYATAFFCGLRNVFPGWSIVQDKALICSQLVAEALERAGHDFGVDSARVSPGDLATHFGVPRR